MRFHCPARASRLEQQGPDRGRLIPHLQWMRALEPVPGSDTRLWGFGCTRTGWERWRIVRKSRSLPGGLMYACEGRGGGSSLPTPRNVGESSRPFRADVREKSDEGHSATRAPLVHFSPEAGIRLRALSFFPGLVPGTRSLMDHGTGASPSSRDRHRRSPAFLRRPQRRSSSPSRRSSPRW